MHGMAILGVDVGGTFTDAVLLAGGAFHSAKVPTQARQEESVIAAARAVLDAAGGPELERFGHGTTIATNALLERKGARTAFVTTEGFEHLLHLRRQNRADLYRLDLDHPEPLVPLERCVGVRERIGPEGVVTPLDLTSSSVDAEAIAVCLLFSFRDASHERAVAEELADAVPTRTSWRRTRSPPNSGSTNVPRRPPSTRTSAPSSPATSGRSAAHVVPTRFPRRS